MKLWLSYACESNVVKRASTYALIVGIILILINQWDVLLSGDLSARTMVKMGLTVLVPYMVSTCSSVGALFEVRTGKKIDRSQNNEPSID